MTTAICEGETVHDTPFENQLREYCATVNPFLPQILRKWGGGCGYRDRNGALAPLSLYVLPRSERYKYSSITNQLEMDGDCTVCLFHRTGEEPIDIGAYMSFTYPLGNPNGNLSHKGLMKTSRAENIRALYPEIPADSLWVTQLQGPLDSFSKNHRSSLINPLSDPLSGESTARLPWERIFLEMAVDIARYIGEPRVYLLPAQYNPYYLSEDKIRFHVKYEKDPARVISTVKYAQDRNNRLMARYNGTPRSMGWQRMPNKGPWYYDA